MFFGNQITIIRGLHQKFYALISTLDVTPPMMVTRSPKQM
jgi:hypothetical protein